MLCVMRERRIIIIIIIAIISTEYWTIFQMHTKHFQSLIDKSFNIQFAECYLWLNMLNTNDGMQLHTSNGLNVAMSLRISRPMCLYDFGWLLSLFIFFFYFYFFRNAVRCRSKRYQGHSICMQLIHYTFLLLTPGDTMCIEPVIVGYGNFRSLLHIIQKMHIHMHVVLPISMLCK